MPQVSYLYDFLKWRYRDHPLLERCRQTYPVMVLPATAAQIDKPESVLSTPLVRISEREDEFIIRDDTYRRQLEAAGKKIENRLCFTFRSLQANGEISVQCGLGHYFDALDTCYALEWELLHEYARLPATGISENAFHKLQGRLPLREKIHLGCPDPIRSGYGRSAFIGISVLICYRDGDEYYLWLRKRSDTTVAVDTGLFHVIPSFVFQPATGFIEQEYSVIHNLKREYLEELFNRPEPRRDEKDFRYFYKDPGLLFLENLIIGGLAAVHLSGIAVNLLNLRPEICLLLFIKSNDWYSYHRDNMKAEQRFHLNNEWAALGESPGDRSAAPERIPLSSADDMICDKFGLLPGKIAPAGAAALWLGLDLLRLLGLRK